MEAGHNVQTVLVNKRLTVPKTSISADRILASNSSDDQPSNVKIFTRYRCVNIQMRICCNIVYSLSIIRLAVSILEYINSLEE